MFACLLACFIGLNLSTGDRNCCGCSLALDCKLAQLGGNQASSPNPEEAGAAFATNVVGSNQPAGGWKLECTERAFKESSVVDPANTYVLGFGQELAREKQKILHKCLRSSNPSLALQMLCACGMDVRKQKPSLHNLAQTRLAEAC